MDMVGDEVVTLRQGAASYPMGFIFAACTADDVNDGSIPFGRTISSATIEVFSVTGHDITADVCPGGASVSGGLRVDVTFDHAAGLPNGTCKVILNLTLDNAAVLPKRWDGLEIADDG